MRLALILNTVVRNVNFNFTKFYTLHYSFNSVILSKYHCGKVSSLELESSKRSFSMMSGLTFGEPATIGTHDGVFHCDEALACYLLRKLPQLKNAEIIRSRDPKVLDKCSIVVDVGGFYDPERHRYDHHQRDFKHTLSSIRPDYPDKHIRLSSAGLIYTHFGKEIIGYILNNPHLTDDELKLLYLRVYEDFVEELDGIDNGIPQYSEGKAAFRINTHVSARIQKLNPNWNSPADVDVQELFYKAMALVGKEFEEALLYAATVWLPGRQLVKEAIEKRFDVDKTGQIMELLSRCPWKEHLFSLEKELGIKDDIKFVIFQDIKGQWRVQGIPTEPNGFICRVFLHDDWQGLRDEELSKKSGIPNSIFVHANGFIGGNSSRDGVLSMARKSLELKNSKIQ